jgi:hypothetical protein
VAARTIIGDLKGESNIQQINTIIIISGIIVRQSSMKKQPVVLPKGINSFAGLVFLLVRFGEQVRPRTNKKAPLSSTKRPLCAGLDPSILGLNIL